MVQQTAVEWLIDKIAEKSIMEKDRYYIPYNSGTIDITDLIEQAKQMEKKQTEISNEEIEEQSKYWNETTNPDMWTFKLAWKAGAKWYREQLKIT